MQMLWTDSFKSRVLFNASKEYVRQLDKGMNYKGLQPVYALSLVNEIFENETEEYYHHYKIVHVGDSTKTIDGLQLIFVELPKFTFTTMDQMKLKVLWLRYLSEIQNGQEMIDQDLLRQLSSVEEISEALNLTKESSYTKAELEAYDKYWDTIRTERTLIADAEAKGKLEGKLERKLEGKLEGKEEGRSEEKISIILTGYENGVSISMLALLTRLTEAQVSEVLQKNGLV